VTEVSANREEPIEEALAEYFASVDRREPASISRLIAAFPNCGPELRRFFETERRLNEECRNLDSLAARTFAVPAKIGRFVVQRALGSGAFGVVYLAVDEALKRRVALKVPLPQVVGDGESRRRFEAEAAAAARLDHDGIVAVYEADFTAPTPYIASAYCPGPDLGRWLAERGQPVPWSEAALLMARLADAVDFAHQAGVFHRDLKPSNVLLMPGVECEISGENLNDFTPQLTDFGLAKCTLLNDAQTRSSMLIGTPLYMAPEQLESTRIEQPILSDVYSLGCILYELTTGTVPITGDSYASVLDRLREVKPAPLRQFAADAPKEFEIVCHKCLEKNPQARYASAGELASDLRACIEHRPIAAAKPSLAIRFRYWLTRPQRVLEAGWYTLCVQLLLTIWVGVALAASSVMLSIPAGEMATMFAEFGALTLLVNLPMAAIGWYTTQHNPWAIRAGLCLTIVNLAAPIVFVALSRRMFFNGIYARVDSSNYFAVAVCTLVLLAELGQLVLYIAAYTAQKHAPSG
jgi:tRNA A-37 threonylcarbamoyl transferase component Bud32